MYYLFILLLIAHFTFDFYLQTSSMVDAKKAKNWPEFKFFGQHFLHATLHFLGFTIATIVFFMTKDKGLTAFPWLVVLTAGAIMALVHLLIDFIKEFLNYRYQKNEMVWFVIDQCLHLTVLLLVVICLNKFHGIHASPKDLIKIEPVIKSFVLILGVVILIKPTSIFVMRFLEMAMCDGKTKHISVTKSHVAKMFDDALSKDVTSFVSTENLNKSDVDSKVELYIKNANIIADSLEENKDGLSVDVENVFSTNNGGKWIGYTERVMIFSLYLLGQFTAIAAVMAIKTAFRFNDLKDDNDSQRSEYIMLGTFSSLFVTIIVSVLVKHFVHIPHFSEMITGFRALF